MESNLSNTVSIKTVSEDARTGVFEIEGLYAGYGLTLGTGLRRTLLSSLPGAAITYIKIKNAPHEFTTLPGVKEDIINLMLNFKKVRFEMQTDEPQVLSIRAKGEKAVTAGDIETNSMLKVMNPDEVLATLTGKDSEFEVELTVERGMGYSPAESRQSQKLSIGVIALDAFFSPVTNVSYKVENMRVGDRTDYNKLHLEVHTDGTISPSEALARSASILKEHFEKASEVEVKKFEAAEAKKKRSKKEE